MLIGFIAFSKLYFSKVSENRFVYGEVLQKKRCEVERFGLEIHQRLRVFF